MGSRGSVRRRARGLMLSLAVLGALAVALPAGASAAKALYADGHPFDSGRYAEFGGNTLVGTFDGCSDAEWAAALARTDYDVLIVGENAPGCFTTDLSAGTLSAIANYVRSGHRYIETGAHNHQDAFMNAVFGFSITNTLQDDNETLTGTLQPVAAGTPFAGGPAGVKSVDQTDLVGNTPGIPIYTSPEGTWVFTTPFGAGAITYVAWDLCGEFDGCGIPPFTAQDDWYRVLDRAGHVTNGFVISSIARNKKKGTATITGTTSFPGELVGSGNGVKAASAGGAVISKSVGAGQAQLLVKAKGKKKKKLRRKGKVKVNVAITYTASGGSPTTQSVKVKLKKKHKK
jgi:hypothetical protein